jgi:hypothetical protein
VRLPRCRIPLIVLCLLMLAGCASSRVLSEWPETVPEQSIFLQAYQQDLDNQAQQSDVEYLTWVVRFYEGWEMMATGWNDMTPVVLSDLSPQQSEQVAEMRDNLGVMIAAEWAKDNDERIIDTRMLSLWGGVMVAALDPEVRIDAIALITDDVERLLAGELAPARINDARYTERLPIVLD